MSEPKSEIAELVERAMALANAATPGRWEADIVASQDMWVIAKGTDGHIGICRVYQNAQKDQAQLTGNAAFIAASRQLIPELCEAITRLSQPSGEEMDRTPQAFWIIEPTPESYVGISVGFTPAFWTGREYPHAYTRDINLALQFCRKVDANVYIAKHLQQREGGIPQWYAVEHMWMPLPLSSGSNKSDEGKKGQTG